MDQTNDTRILIVHNQRIIRSALETLIEDHIDVKIVGSVATGTEALIVLRDLAVDIVIIDADMPLMGGISATHTIREKYPKCGVLLLASHPQFSSTAVQAGARGFLLKDADIDDLLVAIRAVSRGNMYIQAWDDKPDEMPLFSETELKILNLMSQSATNAQIGQATGYADSTVRTYVSTIIRKLGAHGREHAVLLAARCGLLR